MIQIYTITAMSDTVCRLALQCLYQTIPNWHVGFYVTNCLVFKSNRKCGSVINFTFHLNASTQGCYLRFDYEKTYISLTLKVMALPVDTGAQKETTRTPGLKLHW